MNKLIAFRISPKTLFAAFALTLTGLLVSLPESDAYGTCDGCSVSSDPDNNTGDCAECTNLSGDYCINQSGYPKCDPD